MADGDLYERDFYVWAQAQAELLRRRAAGANTLDWDHLAEEVEGLARSEARASESLLRRIVEHILKILAADDAALRDVEHWRQEIIEFRMQLEDVLTPTLRTRLESRGADLIARQVRLHREADRELKAVWLDAPPTLAQCLDGDWFPQAGARTLAPAEPV